MKISVNVKYMMLQGIYWMIFCVAMGFISLYLLDEGVSNSAIGVITAGFGIGSACLQPTFGRLCDKSDKVSWKLMIRVCLIAFGVDSILMIFLSGKVISAVLVGGLILLANLMMPFVNSALFYYDSVGERINFGVARGIGSAMYAILALIIGNLAAGLGTKVVPEFGVLLAVLGFIVVSSLPYSSERDKAGKTTLAKPQKCEGGQTPHECEGGQTPHEARKCEGGQTPIKCEGGQTPHEDAKGLKGKTAELTVFVKKYKYFFMMLAAFALLQASHSLLCNFMLQIISNIGGDSSNLGTAMAIQAIVEVPVLFCFVLLLKKFSATTLMGVASIGYLIKTICFFAAGTVTAFYFSQLTQIISFAVFASASVYYTADMIDEEDRTTGQALMTVVIVCGNVLGSLVGGFVMDGFGIRTMLIVNIFMAVVGTFIAHYAGRAGFKPKAD